MKGQDVHQVHFISDACLFLGGAYVADPAVPARLAARREGPETRPFEVQHFGRSLAVNDWVTIWPSRTAKVSVAISYALALVSAFQTM